MFEPTAPQSNDSTAPRAVMVSVGAMKSERLANGILARLRRSARSNVRGMAPIIGADQLKAALRSEARIIPINEDGNRAFHFAGQKIIVPITTRPSVSDCQSGVMGVEK